MDAQQDGLQNMLGNLMGGSGGAAGQDENAMDVEYSEEAQELQQQKMLEQGKDAHAQFVKWLEQQIYAQSSRKTRRFDSNYRSLNIDTADVRDERLLHQFNDRADTYHQLAFTRAINNGDPPIFSAGSGGFFDEAGGRYNTFPSGRPPFT